MNDIGFEKIALKIKPDTENINYELKFLKKLIDENNYSCEILTGNILNYINKTKNVIGGVSTSVWESLYLNIPYYIYEPKDMGLLNYQINNSILFNNKNVCRDLITLKKNILEKKFFRFKKQIMFGGTDLENIKI